MATATPTAAPPILDAVRASSPADRAAVLADLLASLAAAAGPGGAVPVPGPDGRQVGYFMPAPDPALRPPELTPADLAELDRRLSTLDRVVDLRDVIAEYRRLAATAPPGS